MITTSLMWAVIVCLFVISITFFSTCTSNSERNQTLMCQRLCKANKLFYLQFWLMVYSINLIFMYLHIKSITVIKEKRNISCFKYRQQTFSATVILWNEYFLFLLKLRDSLLLGHVACHNRCPSIVGACIMFIS